jgi:hypothetical protein
MTKYLPSNTATSGLVGQEIKIIFDRIAAFFVAAGANRDALVRQLEESINSATARKPKIRFVRNQNYPILERAVQIWISDPNYLNRAGRPRPIPKTGTLSISALLRDSGYTGTTASGVTLLHTLGAVSKNSLRQYVLNERYCSWHADGDVAYEPQANFLMNAVLAATTAIGRSGRQRKLFWRTCYTDRLPPAIINKYLAFSRTRSEAMILELNDWFGQYEALPTTKQPKRPLAIVGMGLFPFVQSVSSGNPEDSMKASRHLAGAVSSVLPKRGKVNPRSRKKKRRLKEITNG